MRLILTLAVVALAAVQAAPAVAQGPDWYCGPAPRLLPDRDEVSGAVAAGLPFSGSGSHADRKTSNGFLAARSRRFARPKGVVRFTVWRSSRWRRFLGCQPEQRAPSVV